ncbi:MAG TPA: SRPBCC family protein, partial [Pseudoxanthomonas sp.]
MNASYATLVAPDTIRIERTLPGPIERVWAFLTESDKRARWLAAGEMDLRIGGSVEHVFRNSELTENDEPPPAKYAKYGAESRMHGRITACEPPRLLAYTWGEPSGENSEVRFELSADGDDVRLVLIHSRLPNREEMLS